MYKGILKVEVSHFLKKDYRDNSAIAEGETSDVYVLKKKHLEEELLKFPSMSKYMQSIANEKRTYNKLLISKIIKKY
jgi:hypothetical protein